MCRNRSVSAFFRLLAAMMLLTIPCFAVADDSTVASQAVQVGGDELIDRAVASDENVKITLAHRMGGFTSSGSDSFEVSSDTIRFTIKLDDDKDEEWRYPDTPDWVAGNMKCTLKLYSMPEGKLIETHNFSKHDYDSLNYEREGNTVTGTVSYSFKTDLGRGFYRVKTIVYVFGKCYSDDDYGDALDAEDAVCYAKPNVTNLVDRGTIMSSYKFNSSVELCWFPTVNWTFKNEKETSTRYRVYIYDQQYDDDNKAHNKPHVFDEETTHQSISVKGTLLPYGDYTVYVECKNSSGTVLETKKCLLCIRDQSYSFDWDVGAYTTPEPGEHATRQHAQGDKDMTSYAETFNTAALAGNMTQLTADGTSLDIDCSGTEFRTSVTDDTLTLNGSDDAWRVNQRALEILKDSGIKNVCITTTDGQTLTIPTDIEFSGYQYTKLRAKGLVSKDFTLVYENGKLCVEADNTIFDLNDDGTLAKQTAEDGAA